LRVYVYGAVWLAFAAMALHGAANLALFLVGREEPADAADAE
jgi:hypothetical protein